MDSFLDTLKSLGAARLGIMAAVLFGLLIFFVFISMRSSAPEMELLYGDLTEMDSAEMAIALEESLIPFQITPDGKRIEVPEEDVGRARMLLAAKGLPNGGNMGYEIFDEKQAFGTTDFVQNINQLRALEGELARTVSTLTPVRSSRIHLVLPERELFSRESRPASASVFVNLRPGNRLDKGQTLAIQHLVASAVPQLKPDSVSIIDGDGNLLARGDGPDGEEASIANAEEKSRSFERRLTVAIEDMVSRIVGHGKVRANVTANINFDRISTNSEIYDPESQVARSTQLLEEESEEQNAGDNAVTLENNLPGLGITPGSPSGSSANTNRTEEIVNYEISRTVRNEVRESGEVEKLSVAVLVDGSYTFETDENGEETGEPIYVPRSQEELEQIRTLVASAIGFDAARGDQLEVVNLQFADPMLGGDGAKDDLIFGFERDDLLSAMETVTLSIVAILIFVLILQPMVSRLLATAEAQRAEKLAAQEREEQLLASQARAALTGPDGEEGEEETPPSELDEMIDMQQVEGRVRASSVKKIGELVDAHPAETVSVLRSWMSQDA